MFNLLVRNLPNAVSQNIISTFFRVGAWAAAKQREDKFHSAPKLVIVPGMDVKIIPALQDNYMYLIVDNETKEAAVIDPVEPEHVLSELKGKDIKLTKILTTHHHWDHAGGNKKLLKAYPELPVYGGDERVEGLTTKVGDGDKLFIGNLEVDCLHTPCHTRGHICYVVKPKNEPQAVFTGDTLFIAGCGRFFEGTADQMYNNLYKKLGTLPNDTKVFCGHEYTYANLKFAAFVDSENKAVANKLEWAEKMRTDRQTTIPSTIEMRFLKRCITILAFGVISCPGNHYKQDDPSLLSSEKEEEEEELSNCNKHQFSSMFFLKKYFILFAVWNLKSVLKLLKKSVTTIEFCLFHLVNDKEVTENYIEKTLTDKIYKKYKLLNEINEFSDFSLMYELLLREDLRRLKYNGEYDYGHVFYSMYPYSF